ncbi:hypothetical protein JB92DRAFT_1317138 [Gautieria morchelliformis]|nr:hypothetical protein JB92DRAFT_1317138 [Gautieria morchelliformis]
MILLIYRMREQTIIVQKPSSSSSTALTVPSLLLGNSERKPISTLVTDLADRSTMASVVTDINECLQGVIITPVIQKIEDARAKIRSSTNSLAGTVEELRQESDGTAQGIVDAVTAQTPASPPARHTPQWPARAETYPVKEPLRHRQRALEALREFDSAVRRPDPRVRVSGTGMLAAWRPMHQDPNAAQAQGDTERAPVAPPDRRGGRVPHVRRVRPHAGEEAEEERREREEGNELHGETGEEYLGCVSEAEAGRKGACGTAYTGAAAWRQHQCAILQCYKHAYLYEKCRDVGRDEQTCDEARLYEEVPVNIQMSRQVSEEDVVGRDECARLAPHVRTKRNTLGCTAYGEDDEEVLRDVYPFDSGCEWRLKRRPMPAENVAQHRHHQHMLNQRTRRPFTRTW